ncbi:uncharacterized protein LOC110444959 [Mizuhopecten yessoensis]|uniref:uncharacterized protein LOC110444959 n=1 Tax=Mizuhopecten yessoensis TaxID=6573 RepID=UPI000B4576B6|nr:uncharacterized protein LOC110444959 [Mizuhopecten yessoensis]XP_021344995.1 uncharacterized protein LOC110444959 [Mizuhopecten yessoensis]
MGFSGLWMRLLCFGILMCSCYGNVATSIEPVLVMEGDPYLLVMYDMHSDMDPGGNCTELNPRALEMLWSLRWIDGVLQSKPTNKVGLLVYDMCGSKSRAIQVVSRYLNPDDCGNNTNLAGIISYTSYDVRNTISDLVKPFGILHAKISVDEHISKGRDTVLDIATFSPWKTQAVTVLLSSAGLTRISTLAVNTPSARAEQRLFKRMALDQQFCVTDSDIFFNTSSIDSLGSKVAIVFVAGQQDLSDLLIDIKYKEDYRFIVVGDFNILNVSATNLNNVVFLRESLPAKGNMLFYLANMLNNIETMTDPISRKYLQSLPFCARNVSTGQTICSKEVMDYLSPRMNGRDMMAVFTSFFNLERLILRAEAFNCTDFNFEKCNKYVPYVALSINQPDSGFPFNLNELTEGWLVDEPVDVLIMSAQGDNVTEIGRILKNDLAWSTSTIWHDFQTKINRSNCANDECIPCDACAYSVRDTETVAFLTGDLYVGGFFPLHTSSVNGDGCGAMSWEATQLTEAFLYAVDTLKSRHLSAGLLPYVTLGAFVIDSCGNSGNIDNIIEQKMGCPAVYQEENHVDLNDVLSFVEFNNDPFQSRSELISEKPVVRLSNQGVGLNDFMFSDVLPEILSLLTDMNWTYISVVISKQVNKDEAVQRELQMFREKGVCVSQMVVFDSTKPDMLNVTAEVFGLSRKSDAVLLLTLPVDSARIIEVAKNAYSLNVLLAPWSIPEESGVDLPGMVIVKPKFETNLNFHSHMRNIDSMKHSRNPWLGMFHESYHRCHYHSGSDILYPERCTTNATTEGLNKSTLVTHLVHTVDLLVKAIDKLYKEICPLQSGLCPEWKNQPNIQSRINSIIRSVEVTDGTDVFRFHDDGVLKLPHDVMNVRLGDSSNTQRVKIGQFVDSVLTIDDNSVMTYDQSGIPLVVPHHCSNWCPECNVCPSPPSMTSRDHVYIPGDIVFASVFPIHSRGKAPFTCGGLTIAMETEELLDAFLFAVITAKDRYPYLFPNVTVGSLIIDSCSDADETLKTLMNFETCSTTFSSAENPTLSPSPAQVSSYLLYGDTDMTIPTRALVDRIGKLAMSLGNDKYVFHDPLSRQVIMLNPSETVYAVLEFLMRMDWTYVSFVNSRSETYMSAVKTFMTLSKTYNICVSFNHSIEAGDIASTISVLRMIDETPANTVIILATEIDARFLLAELASRRVSKNFIIGDIDQDWDNVKDISIPLGTIVMDKAWKINEDFYNYFVNPIHTVNSTMGNPWFRDFIKERKLCRSMGNTDCKSSSNVLMEASKVVLGVDVLMHMLNHRYMRLCPTGQGLCSAMQDVSGNLLDNPENVSFVYQGNLSIQVPYAATSSGTYVISSFQPSGFKKVGLLRAGRLDIDTTSIKAYDSNGMAYTSVRESRCYQTCVCVNFGSENSTNEEGMADPYPNLLFYDSSAEFDNMLWAVMVLIIALGGAFVVLMFMFYVMYKVCIGFLYRRYIVLGMLMLLSVIFLYLAVIPFVFTPSERVCACRRFIPGLAYAFLFATILAKLMALRAYKLVGLGGELSSINQFLAILFITGIQIAIGVQWLVYEDDFVITRSKTIVQYACIFDKVKFVEYLSYVMFIIVLCAVYSLTVRNEKKNLGEARLILVASWVTIFVWITWLVVIYVEPREYVEPTICVGMIMCATVILMVVFVPKLYRITNLKYDIKDSGMENGGLGKIDAEFIFERPFSLPASTPSEATSIKYSDKTNPKSISTFDSTMSY